MIGAEVKVTSKKMGMTGRADVVLDGTEAESPLEVKTGEGKRFIAAHWAQVTLYAAMFMENQKEGGVLQLDEKLGKGQIVYIGESPLVREIRFGFKELRELILIRNELAKCMEVPRNSSINAALPTCSESVECGFCPQALPCSLLHANGDLGDCADILEAKIRRESATIHLTPGDRAFANK